MKSGSTRTIKFTLCMLWVTAGIVTAATNLDAGDAPHCVVANCSGCHGVKGDSPLPYIPKLAAQNEMYLVQRLRAFQASRAPAVDQLLALVRRRSFNDDPAHQMMIGISHAIDEDEVKAAARWYSEQPGDLKQSSSDIAVEPGKILYSNGSTQASLPACVICHGVAGRGTATGPRLAGQNAAYLRAQLETFRSGARQSSVMSPLASKLDEGNMKQLSSYLAAQ